MGQEQGTEIEEQVIAGGFLHLEDTLLIGLLPRRRENKSNVICLFSASLAPWDVHLYCLDSSATLSYSYPPVNLISYGRSPHYRTGRGEFTSELGAFPPDNTDQIDKES